MNERNINKGRKLNPKKVGALALFVFLLLIMIIAKSSKSPKISIKGDSTVEIALNSEY